mmetsp:Transcript_32602/g.80362  ORF Transcript_32602/g.80362 Transcript_32602/m.80362 type:complete len:222 (+) Transcript_32602:572-1237(+)
MRSTGTSRSRASPREPPSTTSAGPPTAAKWRSRFGSPGHPWRCAPPPSSGSPTSPPARAAHCSPQARGCSTRCWRATVGWTRTPCWSASSRRAGPRAPSARPPREGHASSLTPAATWRRRARTPTCSRTRTTPTCSSTTAPRSLSRWTSPRGRRCRSPPVGSTRAATPPRMVSSSSWRSCSGRSPTPSPAAASPSASGWWTERERRCARCARCRWLTTSQS